MNMTVNERELLARIEENKKIQTEKMAEIKNRISETEANVDSIIEGLKRLKNSVKDLEDYEKGLMDHINSSYYQPD